MSSNSENKFYPCQYRKDGTCIREECGAYNFHVYKHRNEDYTERKPLETEEVGWWIFKRTKTKKRCLFAEYLFRIHYNEWVHYRIPYCDRTGHKFEREDIERKTIDEFGDWQEYYCLW